MTSLAHHADPIGSRLRPASSAASIRALAGRELREALRSRWFILYTIAFAALGLGVAYISAAGSGASGVSGFGRTSAGLINLVLLVVPLMGLTAGAGSIASDRERGMLAYLLAQPVHRWEVLVAKFIGLALALAASICLGFGLCAAVLAWKGGATTATSLALLVVLTLALALAMLSVGLLISALARKASVAMGVAIFAWLAMVFVTDLGVMAGVLALRMRVETLLGISLANPLQVFKMASLHAVDSSIDVLGPAGQYALDNFEHSLSWIFAGSLLAWIVLPLALAAGVFSRRSPL